VKDGLPASGAATVQHVDALGTQLGVHDLRDPLGGQRGCHYIFGGDAQKIHAVPFGDVVSSSKTLSQDTRAHENGSVRRSLTSPGPDCRTVVVEWRAEKRRLIINPSVAPPMGK